MEPEWDLSMGSKIFSLALALFLALVTGSLLAGLAGDSPWQVFWLLLTGAFGSFYHVGMTLFYSCIFILTGLAAAIPLRAGLFSIGGEGQLLIGSLCAAAVGILGKDIPAPWSYMLAGCAAFLGGALWGTLPGFLRAHRNSHEVITTIMCNFIATAITSWVTLVVLKHPTSQDPKTDEVGTSYLLTKYGLFEGAPVTPVLWLVLGCCIGAYFLLKRSSFGFELGVLGSNSRAAHIAGINVRRRIIECMALGGGCAGLVGTIEVLGNSGHFEIGFSAEYGFLGIAVAILARGEPLGVILTGCLFGALHHGSSLLEIETKHVSRDLGLVIQALIIIIVGLEAVLPEFIPRAKRLFSPETALKK